MVGFIRRLIDLFRGRWVCPKCGHTWPLDSFTTVPHMVCNGTVHTMQSVSLCPVCYKTYVRSIRPTGGTAVTRRPAHLPEYHSN